MLSSLPLSLNNNAKQQNRDVYRGEVMTVLVYTPVGMITSLSINQMAVSIIIPSLYFKEENSLPESRIILEALRNEDELTKHMKIIQTFVQHIKVQCCHSTIIFLFSHLTHTQYSNSCVMLLTPSFSLPPSSHSHCIATPYR